MIAAAFVSILVALSGPVHRWSSPVAIEGKTITFSDQGVSVQPEGEIIPVLIPWFDVQSVPNGWTGEAAKYKEIAELAHKARSRRLRGDSVAAAPLYRTLDERLKSVRGEQALDIAIGLMEAALVSKETRDAIGPWLAVLRIGGTGDAVSAAGIDAQTGLHPAILPVFQEQQNLESALPEIGERERIFLRYYQLAMNPPADEQADQVLSDLLKQAHALGGRDTGLRFVHDIVKCQVDSDPAARKSAREALARRIRSGVPGWMESWGRLAMGVSLLGESDSDSREQGVLECIAVVVSSQETPTSVVRLAADIASAYLRSTGRDQYADTLLMTAFLDNESTPDSRP